MMAGGEVDLEINEERDGQTDGDADGLDIGLV
jgi:hypothetical protein